MLLKQVYSNTMIKSDLDMIHAAVVVPAFLVPVGGMVPV